MSANAVPKLELNEKLNGFKPDEVFYLCDVEVETVRRAAEERGLFFDPNKRRYTGEELSKYGLIREGYNREELRERGIVPGSVSSLDYSTAEAESTLLLGTPFANGIEKFQLPIDMLPIQVAKIILPPNSIVRNHVHPPHSKESPGGGLRIIVSGRIFFKGREYGPGDWFFVSNGEPYEFTTDPDRITIVFYTYRFFGVEDGNRFSHPFKV
ncbi:MAG: hypothetical protein AB1489_26435 [Acidobacteriota bacterium]